MMSSKIARDEIVTFFRSVMERRFTDAERALAAVREKRFGSSDFKAGYLNALDGILLSSRSGDPRDFINRVPFDVKSMGRYNREFLSFVKDGIHTSLDVGYFSAWSDFLHYQLNKMKG
jgi:hypothetical protein